MLINPSIRLASSGDEAMLIKLFDHLDSETCFMTFSPDERGKTVTQQAHIIKAISLSDTRVMSIACIQQQIVGFIRGFGNSLPYHQHCMQLSVGVRSSHWGMGLGRQLLDSLLTWANCRDYHRIELTVMASNHRAKALFDRAGFCIEGIKQDALYRQGQYIPEYYMSKLI